MKKLSIDLSTLQEHLLDNRFIYAHLSKDRAVFWARLFRTQAGIKVKNTQLRFLMFSEQYSPAPHIKLGKYRISYLPPYKKPEKPSDTH